MKTTESNITNELLKIKSELYYTQILNASQRLFTALDRDPDSPTFGSFDRDYWHYKIRDFSSIVLHQAALSIDSLYHWSYEKNIFFMKPVLKHWVSGSLNHWCKTQLKNGSFNEYYPYEEGYPPTAFSLYATTLLVLEKKYTSKNILEHIEKASSWILNHPELEASNQEAIGLCSVYLASLIPGVKINKSTLLYRFSLFFASQSDEGWFPEYNGPDIGYLSVTIDALWDYYKHSQDERALQAMKKACDFIELFITEQGNIPVMINSRNTDYIVPYGIFNLALHDNQHKSLFYKILNKITAPYNFLTTTDDRYLCHYIYTSAIRAINALENLKCSGNITLKKGATQNLIKSGIFIYIVNQYIFFINYRKGGIVYLYDANNLIYTHHGYRYHHNNTIGVTNWLSDRNNINIHFDQLIKIDIIGHFVTRKWLIPTPFKHIVLRFLAFTIGNKIIPFLKKIFIFKDTHLPISFHRQLILDEKSIQIIDSFHSSSFPLVNINESPYYSMRHVSSAVRFTPDELLWNSNPDILVEKIKKQNLISIDLELKNA